MHRLFKQMASLLLAGTAGLAGTAQAADSFWVPLADGQVWSFLQSGTLQESTGLNEVWGPDRMDVAIHAVNQALLGQPVQWRADGADGRYLGTYLAEDAFGLWRVSEGNPATDAQFRYYDNPQPWLYMKQPMDVGQVLNFGGNRHGQWQRPDGSLEAWTGTWTLKLTHVGSEAITTALGSFHALKLRAVTTSTLGAPDAAQPSEWANWDEDRWFVPGLGFVQVQGQGFYNVDFNGDGVVDRWQFETQLMQAVPEPATVALWAAGLAMLAGVQARRRPRA